MQRFKRKHRRRGLNEEEIQQLILLRQNSTIDQPQTGCQAKNNEKKRKPSQRSNHDQNNATVRSMSQLSISQGQPQRKKRRYQAENRSMRTTVDSIPM